MILCFADGEIPKIPCNWALRDVLQERLPGQFLNVAPACSGIRSFVRKRSHLFVCKTPLPNDLKGNQVMFIPHAGCWSLFARQFYTELL